MRSWRAGAKHFGSILSSELADPQEKWVIVAGHENQMGRAKSFRKHFTTIRNNLLRKRVGQGELPMSTLDNEDIMDVPLVLAAKFRTKEGDLERTIIGDVDKFVYE